MSDALVQSATIQNKAQTGGGFGSVPDAPVAGVPIISSISGTFAQGNVLTISGSNFSANRSGQLIYENFDGGVAGELIDDIPVFSQNLTPTDFRYRYSDSGSFSGSKCAVSNFVAGETSAFRPQFDAGLNLKKMFTMMRVKVDVIAEPASDSQIKLARCISISGDHTSEPHTSVTVAPGLLVWQNTGTGNVSQYGGGVTHGTWQSIVMYTDLSTADARNGSRFIKALGQSTFANSSTPAGEDYASVSNDYIGGVSADPDRWTPTNNILTLSSSADRDFIRYLLIPFYKRPTDSYVISVDQVSINDSLESVFISPYSTWSEAKANFTDLMVQPMNSRASTSISVSCEVGNLGASRYLYVMNSDGVANEAGEPI